MFSKQASAAVSVIVLVCSGCHSRAAHSYKDDPKLTPLMNAARYNDLPRVLLECRSSPRYPLIFLDRINSPEKLDSQLDLDLFDDFTKTGVFNREELDETFSGVTRLIFQTRPTGCYAFPTLRAKCNTKTRSLDACCNSTA